MKTASDKRILENIESLINGNRSHVWDWYKKQSKATKGRFLELYQENYPSESDMESLERWLAR